MNKTLKEIFENEEKNKMNNFEKKSFYWIKMYDGTVSIGEYDDDGYWSIIGSDEIFMESGSPKINRFTSKDEIIQILKKIEF